MEIKVKEREYYKQITKVNIAFQSKSHSMGRFLCEKDNFSIKASQSASPVFSEIKVKTIKPKINYLFIKQTNATTKKTIKIIITKTEKEHNAAPQFFSIPVLS